VIERNIAELKAAKKRKAKKKKINGLSSFIDLEIVPDDA